MPADELRREYPELRSYDLVEVDVIDDGETLASVPDESVDFVVANHFIEHTEDPIATLGNHLRVVRPGGVLFMAVPDKRRTFDAARPVTSLEHLDRDHAEGPAWSHRVHYEQWAREVEQVPESQVAARARELDEQGFSIHFHVFTPAAFAELVHRCRDSYGLPVEVEALVPVDHEFIAVLRKRGQTAEFEAVATRHAAAPLAVRRAGA
jgi:SAM-dependent methyltransferase